MRKEIIVRNQKIIYTLCRRRRMKNLRLLVHPGGDFYVSAPHYLPFLDIEKFILKKADWVIEKIDFMKKRGRSALSGKSSFEEYKKLKKDALNLATRKLEEFNRFYGFSYEKITIRNQKSRWGSCSQKGTLSYNYKIAVMPERCSDYIIVHELCHLKEFNHSGSFWELVAKTIPDYKVIRKELRNG